MRISQIKRMGFFAHVLVVVYAALTLTACDLLGDILGEIFFIPVEDITDVPTNATVGVQLPLTATVTPALATKKDITWKVTGGSAAITGGNILTANAAGTITVTATIVNGLASALDEAVVKDFTKNFYITATAAAFVPVTDIGGVPNTATVGIPLPLTATVMPSTATNKAITWSVKTAGTTGATISGSTLNTTGDGEVVVTATIINGSTATSNYAKDFTVTVNSGFVPVTDISDVPTAAVVGVPLALSGTVSPSNATNHDIKWSVTSGPATVDGNTLTASAAGMVVVMATIINGASATSNFTKDDFTITVDIVPVTDITGVHLVATAGIPLALNGTVMPENATNKDITWGVKTGSATITDGNLSASEAGTVTVTATVVNGSAIGTNYTKDFTITVNAGFVAVTGITNVPETAIVGVSLNLNSGTTVTPSNATNQDIIWSVKTAGTTAAGATVNGSSLSATGAGKVVVTARIANGLTAGDYTKDFEITVNIEPVTNITNLPTTAIVKVPLTLSGTVEPEHATNKIIAWSIASAGTTGASISGSTLNTTAAGEVIVTARIANGLTNGDYTKNFTIAVHIVPVSDIGNVPNTATVGVPLALTGTVTPSDATNNTITWSVKSGSATISNGNSLTATAAGTVTVTATVVNGTMVSGSIATTNYTKDFTITVNNAFVPVTDISNVPTTVIVGTSLALTGTVAPTNATYKTIVWSVASAGTTGATVSGNTLSTTGTGTVTVTATITNGLATGTNYTKNFNITVQPETVAFNNLTANGSSGGTSTTTTTQLTLTFAKDITGLAAADITLSSTTGATKGTLTRIGTGTYRLDVSGITSGGEVTVTVTKPNYTFSPASRTVTVHARGTLTPLSITFNQITDNAPFITGPTLYRVSNNGPTTATITVDSPTQYDSISWRVQNTTVTGTGSSFMLSAANSAYNLIGEHFVTVMVVKGGVPYNKTVSFRVEY